MQRNWQRCCSQVVGTFVYPRPTQKTEIHNPLAQCEQGCVEHTDPAALMTEETPLSSPVLGTRSQAGRDSLPTWLHRAHTRTSSPEQGKVHTLQTPGIS